ncbi:MAG: hypothetical protein ACOYN3_09440 [Acidimicrobiia bacterium]
MNDLSATEPVITREDIKSKLEELRGGVGDATEGAQQSLTIVGIVAVGVVIVAAYWLGRRRGARRRTVLEIIPV